MKILFPTIASMLIVRVLAFLGEESESCERIMDGGELAGKMTGLKEK